MMLERQLEVDVANKLRERLAPLGDVQVVCSRSGTKTEGKGASVVAVAAAFRQNDSFSLTPITVNVAVTAVTRVETDVESSLHDEVVEAVADQLSRWHKYGEETGSELSSEKFLAGELRMDGGSARTFDQATNTWRDTIQFSIRGAEKFPAR